VPRLHRISPRALPPSRALARAFGGDAAHVRRGRHRHQHDRGVTMVEFALVAPLFLMLFLGLIVLGLFVLNDVELSNGVRDGARAGAICGAELFKTSTSAQLPNGQQCNQANLVAYIQGRIVTIPGVTPDISVDFSGGNNTSATTCQVGQKIKVTASYAQPLFVPFVGRFWGDPGNTAVRTIFASAEATCEQ
jgi:Flp pilus assembly protein TadG